MEMNYCYYRKLRGYKYQLTEDYVVQTNIYNYETVTPFIQLTDNGVLILFKYYAWDGPSGPTIDTSTFVRPSLIHDAIYQLIRLELLPIFIKDIADVNLYYDCINDGMNKIRAIYVYNAVRCFADYAVKPNKKDDVVYCAPNKKERLIGII